MGRDVRKNDEREGGLSGGQNVILPEEEEDERKQKTLWKRRPEDITAVWEQRVDADDRKQKNMLGRIREKKTTKNGKKGEKEIDIKTKFKGAKGCGWNVEHG